VTTIRIEHEVEIQRPQAEVFDFVSDHDHLPAWTVGVKRAKQTTPGPIGVGTTYAVVGRTMGRRVESTYELTEFAPSTSFSGRMESRLFSIDETYEFEGDGDQTTVRLTADAAPGRLMRVLGPLLGVAVERQIKADHQRLKTILERKRRRGAPREQPSAPVTEG
jgi:carbon monoxide dehydrogenase subunit G